jgi:dipeptidyl aminopeptidase/acylaminoacyl peptidase
MKIGLILLIVCALLIIGQGAAPLYGSSATAVPTPTLNARVDGTIDSLTLLHDTPNSVYYELSYWSDGLRITGYLGYPKTRGPHPAVVYNRGGNRDTGALSGIEIVPLVEAGYVAAASNYRGSAGGEGQEEFGGADVDDVINLVILLQQLPNVDPDRIGMVGGSRGGMMTYIALKRDAAGIIRAAATVGGISDLFAWAQQRPDVVASVYVPLIGVSPSANPQPYEDRSAIYWPDQIRVPLLLLYGDADHEVSPQQSITLAADLAAAGQPVQILAYPGGDHSLSNYQGGYPAVLDWFALYLGGDGVDRSYRTHEQAISDVGTWFLDRTNH